MKYNHVAYKSGFNSLVPPCWDLKSHINAMQGYVYICQTEHWSILLWVVCKLMTTYDDVFFVSLEMCNMAC